LHSDIGGPIEPSYAGFTYWITFLDEGSRRCKTKYLKRKSGAKQVIPEIIRKLQRSSGRVFAIFRSDGGSEYQSIPVQEFFESEGIEHEVSPPYTPQLNGMAERLNRTLMATVRCLLRSSGMPNSFWRHAMEYAVYIYNHTPHSGIEFRTPIEVFHGKPLSKMPQFHVF
jgi:transposase InsO family protein